MEVRPTYIKDPSSVLDYGFDWALWLTTGEIIASATWTVPAGLVKDSESVNGAITACWISGGTAGVDYEVTCEVTTSAGRIDQRSILIRCRQR